MASPSFRPINTSLYPVESNDVVGSVIAWSAIWAGTIVAIAIALILLALGSGFGLVAVSPWPGVGAKPETFTIAAGMWLIVTQWVSSLFGGYVAGRTRTRWNHLHSDEVFFRDTVHGLLSWALSTVVVFGIAVVVGALATEPMPATQVSVSAEVIDAARAVAAKVAFFTAVSLIVGAFIGSVAAAYGGHLRDEHP